MDHRRFPAIVLVAVCCWLGMATPAVAQCPPARLALVTELSSGELSAVSAGGGITRLAGGLTNPHGVDFDPAGGGIYIADNINDALIRLDLATGEIETVAAGIENPFGVAINPAGTVAYMTRARYTTPAGGDLLAVDIATGAVTTISDAIQQQTEIALNAAGTAAYVEVPPSSVGRVNLSTGAITVVAAGLSNVMGMAVNSAETTLYYVDATFPSGRLFAVNLATGIATTVTSTLSLPLSVVLDPSDTTAYVAEGASPGRVVAVTLATGAVTTVATGPAGGSNGVTIDGGDTTLYLSRSSGDILAVGIATGTVTLVFEALAGPTAVAMNRTQETAFVLEFSTLSRVDLITGLATQVAAGLGSTSGIALDDDETTVYVTRGATTPPVPGVLLAVDLATGAVSTVATGLTVPRGVALNPAGTIAYVAESNGEFSAVDLATGAVTLVAAGLTTPWGVTLNDAGTIAYVSEGNGEVSSITIATGAIVLEGAGLTAPRHLALDDAEALLYVTEFTAAGEVSTVNLATGVVLPIATGLSAPSGLALYRQSAFGYVRPSRTDPGTGSRIASCLVVDVQGAGDGLGGYGATLSWNPAVLLYQGFSAGEAPFDTPVVNTANAATGALSFAEADAVGACGSTEVLCVEFDVPGAGGTSSFLDLELTSLFASESFANLLPAADEFDALIEVPFVCYAGDVNGDGLINSGDALIVLSGEIGLPIPPAAAARIAAGCGDVNSDGLSNSTDANILLSFEVGLPLDPALRVADPISVPPTFDACPVGGAGALSIVQPAGGAEAASVGASPIATPQDGGDPVVARVTASSDLPRRGEEFEVVLSVDLGAGGRRLGSYAAGLTWDPRALEMIGTTRGSTPGFASPVLNRAQVAAGELRFAQANPMGADGTVEILRVRFRALHAVPHPDRRVRLSFTSLASPGPRFESLLHRLVVVP